jgi:putative membrane protein
MKHLSIATVTVGIAALVVGALGLPIGPGLAQGGPGPGYMMSDWGWGGGFMWLMPLAMMAWFALIIVAIVLLVRWLGVGSGGRSASTRTARDILDERYARGEIDRKDYLQRQKDIPGE